LKELAGRLGRDKTRVVQMVDQNNEKADEAFWRVFGGKYKLNEPTPKGEKGTLCCYL
jgi:hypothetical protein